MIGSKTFHGLDGGASRYELGGGGAPPPALFYVRQLRQWLRVVEVRLGTAEDRKARRGMAEAGFRQRLNLFVCPLLVFSFFFLMVRKWYL